MAQNRKETDIKMLAKEMRHKAIAAHYAISEEYNAILRKIEQSALSGYFEINWYTSPTYDLLLDKEYGESVNPSNTDAIYTVDNLYKIIVYLLQEDGYEVINSGKKLVISWGSIDFVENFIRN